MASHLGAQLGLRYFRLDARDRVTGSSSTLLSNLAPALRANWDLDWTRDWTSRLEASYQAYRIMDDVNSGRSIANASGALLGFALGGARRWSERARTFANLGFRESLYEHATSPTILTMDRVGTPRLEFGHQHDIFTRGPAHFGAKISVEILLPGRGPGYETELGRGAMAELYLEHQLKSLRLRGGAFYGLHARDSALATQRESSTGLHFGLTWKVAE